MSIATPATADSTLIDEINVVVCAMGPFLETTDSRVFRLLRVADQVAKVDQARGLMCKAMVYQLTGDLQKALTPINQALDLRPADSVLLANKGALLSNYGHFSEAHALYKRSGQPGTEVPFAWATAMGCSIGAFVQANEFVQRAVQMGIEVAPEVIDLVKGVAEFMRIHDIKDSDLASILDVAGRVIFETRTMLLGPTEVKVWDGSEDPSLCLTLKASFDSYRSEQLDTEFADRLSRTSLALPWALSVSIQSGLDEQNERYPEGASAARV